MTNNPEDRSPASELMSEPDAPEVADAVLIEHDGQAALAEFADGTRSGEGPEEECEALSDAPAQATAAAALDELTSAIRGLSGRQDDLRELFESKIRSDEIQAKALERLHDQLQDYKANFVRQEMLPLLRDLIYCYDVADDEAGRARTATTPPTAEGVAQTFDHLRQMVADVLAKYDVEPYRVAGTEFNRREQQCVRTVPTVEPTEDKKVAAVGAMGFRLGEQIIRKEQVIVYKFAPGAVGTEVPAASVAS